MTEHTTPIEQMVHLAEEMTEAAVAGQAVGLQILAAEMQALTQIMPGMTQALQAHVPQSDTEIEAEFDNMPV